MFSLVYKYFNFLIIINNKYKSYLKSYFYMEANNISDGSIGESRIIDPIKTYKGK